jgi:hypothetical protein
LLIFYGTLIDSNSESNVSTLFRVQHVILSDDIATARFACNIAACKGACCVVGDAGAPVAKSEIPVLNKAYQKLKPRLRDRAVSTVQDHGLVVQNGSGSTDYELSCTDNKECVFVTYDEQGIAECAIQKAYQQGEFEWPKPISCHLFPIRLKKVGQFEYANYEYVPSICTPACDRGKEEGIYLSEFLKEPLTRRYGDEWYVEFSEQCEQVRSRYQQLQTL